MKGKVIQGKVFCGSQDVLEGGENLTGTRHPSRQAMEEEGAEGTVSLDE